MCGRTDGGNDSCRDSVKPFIAPHSGNVEGVREVPAGMLQGLWLACGVSWAFPTAGFYQGGETGTTQV